MTEEEFEQIRDKDHVILKHIEEGQDDVQNITSATTLENHHVSYSFQKLEQQGLIEVSKPDEMVERVIDGQKRVFQHPKQAVLTEKGVQFLEQSRDEEVTKYEDLSHAELVEKVRKIEEQIESLEQAFETFRKQVQNKIQ